LSYELGTVSYIIIMEQWNYWFSRRMTLIKLCNCPQQILIRSNKKTTICNPNIDKLERRG